MKELWTLTLTLALVGALQTSAGGDNTYYPYQFYEEYYRQQQGEPPAGAPPSPSQGETLRPAPAPHQRAPLFLSPPELGFGVAVATGEDLFYIRETYYRMMSGGWYRSGSYRGPWIAAPRRKLPPELLKRRLTEMRALRDREFRRFWEEKGNYQGEVFRPAERKSEGERPD